MDKSRIFHYTDGLKGWGVWKTDRFILQGPGIWPSVTLDQSLGRADKNLSDSIFVNMHNPVPLSWSARSQTREWSMNFIFPTDAPERDTTGVLDPGLPAAESVDQVRVSKKNTVNNLNTPEFRTVLVFLILLPGQRNKPFSSFIRLPVSFGLLHHW